MDTTLEEVFLKVSEEDQSLENSEAGEAQNQGSAPACPPGGVWGRGCCSRVLLWRSGLRGAGELGFPTGCCLLLSAMADMKESRKDVFPVTDGAVSGEAPAGNLAQSSELAQSQASLQSTSSVGSARGDEATGSAGVYGDYRPLLDGLHDPDNVSLQGGGLAVGALGMARVGASTRSWLSILSLRRG